MKLTNLGLMAIATLTTFGNAVAAEGSRAPVLTAPVMEILVVTAKRPSATESVATAAGDATTALPDFAVLTTAPAAEPHVETVISLPAVEALQVAPPRIEIAFDDLEIRSL
jgi:hypothetical protein